MTRTARRRWTRELSSQVDGIAFEASGPVLLHGYDPPAGGKWIDDVIPGKLGAFARESGEKLWSSPCEVGYGRGFGAGFGAEGEAVVIGPSLQGHSIVRMSIESGELIGARGIEAFDEAIVAPDLCVCVTPGRVSGVLTTDMVEAWVYSQEGERYHMIGRAGELVLVVYTEKDTSRQGLLALNAETGDFVGTVLEPRLGRVHGLAVDGGAVVLLLEELENALSPDVLEEWLKDLAMRGDDPLSSSALSLLTLAPGSEPGARPLWFERLSEAADELPDVGIHIDNGRLYVARGVQLEVRDALTGRALGELAIPGLDENVAFRVKDGAGLLAEETRVTIFEILD